MTNFRNCVFIACLFLLNTAYAQHPGRVLEQQLVKSGILHRPVRYSIYLPAGYDSSTTAYPVVYLLHGAGGNNNSWLKQGEINRYADKAIEDGTIPPMIIVMPDGDSSFYINAYDGKENYEDFFVKEFMPGIEKAYRIKAEKRFRGIAGLSMGGYGTLVYALKYPQLFAAAAPLSASVRTEEDWMGIPSLRWDTVFGHAFGAGLEGKDRLNAFCEGYLLLSMVQNESADQLSRVRYWIDCGDDDGLSKGNSLLHIALMEKKVPHEFRVRNGGHTWTYWRTGIVDALAFIGQSFR